ncbi:MAG: DNA polymerase III subunit alpha [Bacteroidales bacterium]|jgi:error-prone DNA polymerase|nr:DNA polymerase III subunit alpha [Bacteroidales bacterium]
MYLNAHTYYSLRYGTMSPEQLVKGAIAHDIDQLVLTDINNSSAMPDFVRVARAEGLKPIGGIDFRNGDIQLFIGIARNKEGMRELNEYLTQHLLEKRKFTETPLCEHAFIVYPLESVPKKSLHKNEYIGVRPHQVASLFTSPYLKFQDKLVILHSPTIESQNDYSMHCHLRAIDHNILYSRLKPEMCARHEDRLVTAAQLRKRFRGYNFIVRNTLDLMAQCHLDYEQKTSKNKAVFSISVEDDLALLRKLANDGLEYRYRNAGDTIRSRLNHELKIIAKMGFAAYFLIAWDIVRYSMSRGFYHVGRGSGANSLVAYCLKITDVDPIELDLYFERFLNPKRSSPPDFDIDYSWKERNEVRDYVFKRYGTRHTALLGTFNTFKTRSVLRELAKVQGLTKAEIDAFTSNPRKYRNADEIHRKIADMAVRLSNFPNLRSVHAGGILISAEPLTYYTALDLPPLGFPVTQWDMYVAEDLGYEKFDILSQRGIGHVKEAAEIVLETRGKKIDVHDVKRFKADKLVQKRLFEGETIGCFYIESPAMRGLLSKLRCSDYTTLVAASSIIRPGVARSGMMKEYIRRFHHPDKFEYLHPVMKEQLEETYGVMVYQEDVLKVCHHFAGLDLADADILRRAMSGKYRSKKEFQQIVQRFFDNCKHRGYSDSLTKEVWRQIESFAGYAFSKAHSASYAVESFQSLYLKTYYPLEFMVAVINNFGGFYESWVYFNEARRLGAEIIPPCVNRSRMTSRLIDQQIIVGFVHVQHLEQKFAKHILAERNEHGQFQNIFDFMQRVQAGPEQVSLLIRVGAFAFTQKTKAELLWELYGNVKRKSKPVAQTKSLFEPAPRNYVLPALSHSRLEDAWDEISLIGFPIALSWFGLLQNPIKSDMHAGMLTKHIGRVVEIPALYVTIKYVKTVKGEIMYFAAWVDQNGNYFDSVHFPDSLKLHPFRGKGVYLLRGKVVEEFGHPSIEVHALRKLEIQQDPRGGMG